MEYLFKDTGKDNGIAGYPMKDEQEALFVMACLVLRRMNTEMKILSFMKPLEDVLVQLPFAEMRDGKLIPDREKISMAGKITVNASNYPAAVFGLSVLFAATGTEADITGLEGMSTGKELEQVTCLQRMLYRLNINTDYCGGSKFKVYNNKEMKAGLSLKPTTENFQTWLLIMAVIKTGELRLVMEEKELLEKTELLAAGGIAMM